MKKSLFLIAAALLMGSSAFAQYNLSDPLPMDPAIRIGKLENGLTYYIQHNEEPKQRADFYIIYSVGALQEEENQNGLAHFLEHMAFNGTKNFPGGNSESTSIVKTLERHGIAFGRNINAYTSIDRTVYYLNDIMTTDSALIDTCLLVLHDWAHYVTLDPQEIDNERGVISEEWRTRNNSNARMRKQWYPIVFGDTRYTTHDVIGSYEIINNFKYQELKDFYYKWYRTDQQAVAIVGDIDVDDIESRIKSMFSEIPAVENPTPKEKIVLPSNKEPLYALATDKEQTMTSVEMIMLREKATDQTVGGQRDKILKMMYGAMLNQRISDMVSNGDPVLIGGSAKISDFIDGYEAYSINSSAKDDKNLEGFEKVYTEVVRAKRFGFTESEFKRAKLNQLASLDNQYKQKDKTANKTIAGGIVTVFAYNKIKMSMDYFYPLCKYLIDDIKLSEINALAAANPVFDNVKIVIMGKEDENIKYPTREDILASIARIDTDKSITAYVDEDTSDSLMDKDIQSGKIVKEKSLPMFGAKQWKLSNGATVVFARADHDKDVISLTANSYGGSSLYPVEMMIPISCVGQVGTFCGLGKYSPVELKKVLAGKKAKVQMTLNGERETISGSSTVADFETMMQMTYLRFMEPRFDSLQFFSGIKMLANMLKKMEQTPDMVMQDSLTRIRSNYHPRAVSLKADSLLTIKLSDVERIYRERFSNASDYTFFIVGDIDEGTVRDAVEKYIATIPSTYVKEKWVDHNERAPKGHTERKIEIPFQTPKASVNLEFVNFQKIDTRTLLEFTILRDVLGTRYTTNIREKEGGTYGVKSQIVAKRFPKNKVSYTVQFDTEMSKADHLKDLVFKEIESICSEGITDDELENIRKNMLKNREQSKSSNDWVVRNLTSYVLYGEDNVNPKNYEDILKRIKTSDIRKCAAKFFRKADVVDEIFANSFNQE